MSFWIIFWTIVLILGIAVFTGLAIVVTIRGVGDIRSLFKSISSQDDRTAGSGEREASE